MARLRGAEQWPFVPLAWHRGTATEMEGSMPKDNVQAVRSLVDTHMTPTAPLAQALEYLLDEFAVMTAAVNALDERIEALEDALDEKGAVA